MTQETKDSHLYLQPVTARRTTETGALREVVRVVFPSVDDQDALPLYIDGPIQRLTADGVVSGAAAELELNLDDVLGRRSLRVRPGKRVSLGSYFNAFPASYWRWWTDVATVYLTVRTQGTGSLIVNRSNARGVTQRVEVRRLTGMSDNEFELPLAAFNDGGWYWFDLVAEEEDLDLLQAGWWVPSDGVRQGTVTLSMTTFNRPDYAVANIHTIAAAPELVDVVDEMLVVDQGNKLVSDEPDFAEAQAEMKGRLRIIRQANMGGSGGYARGMYEVVQGRPDGSKSDYMMTLDDDIRIETESIRRAVLFADFCRKPTIVGAHMFDLYNRTLMNAFAEVVDPFKFNWGPIEGLGGVDFSDAGLRSRPKLHRRWDANYNGWWMCLIPRKVIEEVGLSLPVFIKWDDSEYSLRAGAHGYPTVSLPGAAVWHVSWMDKDDAVDWQAYFHERNRLIAALLHSPYPNGGRMLRESINVLSKHTLGMQYFAASAVLKAMRDVLDGPEGLHDALPTKTPEVRAMQATFPDAKVSKDIGSMPPVKWRRPPKSPRDAAKPNKLTLFPWAAKTAIKEAFVPPHKLSREYPEATVSHADGTWYYLPTLDSALVTNADGTGLSMYRREPEQVRAKIAEGARLHLELARRWPQLAKQYRDALPRITSPEVWGETFAKHSVTD